MKMTIATSATSRRRQMRCGGRRERSLLREYDTALAPGAAGSVPTVSPGRSSRPAPVLDAGRPGRRHPGGPADRDSGAQQHRCRVRAVPTGTWTPPGRRFFALLGLHPGGTTDSYAAAALADTSPAEATRLLDGLHGEGLVTETGYRRYGMHDLLRHYGRDHAAADPDHDQALGRLLEDRSR